MYGFNTVSLDQKGRLAIPAKYRACFIQKNETQIVITKDPQYPSLKIYPQSEWLEISSKLESLQGLDPIVRNLQWTILAEGIYQSNISNINMMFNSGISKVSKGQCINRNLPLWKISPDTTNPL